MTEKRFVCYEHKGAEYILEDPNTHLDFIEMLGDCLDEKEIVNRLNELYDENEQLKHDATVLIQANQDYRRENEQLKTTISRLIEQNRKNNDLLVSDIRLLEKALWCPNCARNIKRLKELKKEFEND